MEPPHYEMPPRLYGESGSIRRVGVEVEFAGLEIDEAIGIVCELFGGAPQSKNRFEHVVAGTRFGDFRVEVDSKPITERRYLAFLEKLGFGPRAQDVVEDAIEAIARRWIPCEIVAPPIELTSLPALEALREALQSRNAQGTKASLLFGFAFQLNPEVPSLRVESLRRHLQAFLISYDWLLEVSQIDLTRRIGPFINAFPESYRRLVLDPAYAPELDAFVDDYLVSNPTRNRPLDMLPVLAMLRPDAVRRGLPEGHKVNARPTFHYRLPNCMVDDPSWSFALEWNRWCEVERLADDVPRLDELLRAFHARADTLDRRQWAAEVGRAMG